MRVNLASETRLIEMLRGKKKKRKSQLRKMKVLRYRIITLQPCEA
jgi:hypothetical protein